MKNANIRYGLIGFGAVMIVIALIFFMKIIIPMWAMAILAIVAMIALVGPVLYVKKTEATFDEKTLTVRGSYVDLSIKKDSIRSVELRESFTCGDVVNGTSNGWMVGGTYKNSEFGEYTITADMDAKAFIIVRYSGKVLVFNLKTEEQTGAFFHNLKLSIPDNTHHRR